MEIGKLVVFILVLLIAISLLIYAFFTSKEKGPILSNTWLFASKSERRFINKSAEYHLVTVVFSVLSVIFFLVSASILLSWVWIPIVIGFLIISLIVYVIIEAIKTEKNQ